MMMVSCFPPAARASDCASAARPSAIMATTIASIAHSRIEFINIRCKLCDMMRCKNPSNKSISMRRLEKFSLGARMQPLNRPHPRKTLIRTNTLPLFSVIFQISFANDTLNHPVRRDELFFRWTYQLLARKTLNNRGHFTNGGKNQESPSGSRRQCSCVDATFGYCGHTAWQPYRHGSAINRHPAVAALALVHRIPQNEHHSNQRRRASPKSLRQTARAK